MQNTEEHDQFQYIQEQQSSKDGQITALGYIEIPCQIAALGYIEIGHVPLNKQTHASPKPNRITRLKLSNKHHENKKNAYQKKKIMKIENDTGKVQSSFLSPFTNRVTPKLAKGS